MSLSQLGDTINAVVKEFIKNGRKLLSRRETNILSAASFIMITIAASRVLGLVRDRLLASFFGAGSKLGVFWAAVEIPDTLFYILGSAVFSASFIPVFTQYLSQGNGEGPKVLRSSEVSKGGWEMAGSVLNFSLLLFLFLAGLIFIFSRPISCLVAPGFSSEELSLMSGLVRVMTLAQFFFVLSYFLTGMLHSFQRFLVPALAAVVYNLGVVLGIIVLAPRFGIWGPAWGMVFGSLLHFLVQLPLALSFGFSWRSLLGSLFHPGVKRVIRMALPRAAALLGGKLSMNIQVSLASLIPVLDSVSNVAVLTFSRHLELLPIGLFGVSISQAALPALSMNRGSAKENEFKKTFVSSLHQTLFLAAPAAVILLVLRIPAVRLAFGAKRFTWKATILTGYTVAFFSLGIIFGAILHLLNRAFYALEEAKTPVKISLLFSGLGIFLSWVLTRVFGFGVWAIPLSLSVAGFLQSLVLFLLLQKSLGRFERESFFAPISKIGWAAFFSGIALYIPMKLLDELVLDTTRTLNLLVLTAVAGAFGLSVYLFFTWILGVRETKLFLHLILARFRHRR